MLALIRVEELVEVFRKWGKTSGEEIVERLVEIAVELIVEEVLFRSGVSPVLARPRK